MKLTVPLLTTNAGRFTTVGLLLLGSWILVRNKRHRRQAGQAVQISRALHVRNQEIQNFHHTLAHELKTPLTSAREFIAIVLDGLAGPLSATQREYLGLARESCDQLRGCISDLFDATRLETGKLSLEWKPVSLGPLIHRAVAGLQSFAHEKSISLTVAVETGLPRLDLDENRFLQVINNLLTNALKFTPPEGRVIIAVRSVSGPPASIELSVSDTGCGISPAEQDRIFDRLYQVQNGDAATGQGIGLGLHICRELVSLHGGSISVESEPGRGATFRVILPRSAGPPAREGLRPGDHPALRELRGEGPESEQFKGDLEIAAISS